MEGGHWTWDIDTIEFVPFVLAVAPLGVSLPRFDSVAVVSFSFGELSTNATSLSPPPGSLLAVAGGNQTPLLFLLTAAVL